MPAASPSITLAPLAAYDEVLSFASGRGEPALRLALHAAVPQVLRPELLHLLRLNFTPESGDDPALEADVLFAAFCTDLGNGYFRFDGQVRLHLLSQLDPAYEHDAKLRSRSVGSFLLSYLAEQARGTAAGSDPLYEAYIETERWGALAFYDPAAAAAQLAVAVQQACDPGNVAARLRIGGLAAALAVPLAPYQQLLAYTAGVEALQAGNIERARGLLDSLGDKEIGVAGVTLPSPRSVLGTRTDTRGPSEQPAAEPEVAEADRAEETASAVDEDQAATRYWVHVSYSHKDQKTWDELQTFLRPVIPQQIALWDDRNIAAGKVWRDEIGTSIKRARAAIVVLSADYLGSDFLMREELPLLVSAAERGTLQLMWICATACPWQDTELARFQAANDPRQPLNQLSLQERRRVLVDISKKIAEAVAASQPNRAATKRIYIAYQPEDRRIAEALSYAVANMADDFKSVFRNVPDPNVVASRSQLEADIAACDAVVAVIGPKWMKTSRQGAEDDAVTLQLAAALMREIPIIPVLVGGAKMPARREVPALIAALTERQAFLLSNDRFEHDVAELVDDLKQIIATTQSKKPEPPPEPRVRVFVSGTEDLRAERAAVFNVLTGSGFEAVGMENAPASASNTVDWSRDAIRNCDVFVCIVDQRYGSVPAGSTKSFTEIEYDEARKLDKPTLAFLRARGIFSPQMSPPDTRLEQFEAELRRNSTCTQYQSSQDLAAQVVAAVRDWQQHAPERPRGSPDPTTASAAEPGAKPTMQFVRVVYPRARAVLVDGTQIAATNELFQVSGGVHTFSLDEPTEPSSIRKIIADTTADNPCAVTFAPAPTKPPSAQNKKKSGAKKRAPTKSPIKKKKK